MLKVSVELKDKLKQVNNTFQQAFPSLDIQLIRERLSTKGQYVPIARWKKEKISEWLKGHSLFAVDGSVNTTRGAQMRSLSLFQALIKGTRGEEKWKADIHTPLLMSAEERLGGNLLSQLEIAVTTEAIMEWRPKVIFMDGSLQHFAIDAPQQWTELMVTAERCGTLLVGVSEEISSRGLAKSLFSEYPYWSDREVFYGLLYMGEAYLSPLITADTTFWKAAFRSSNSPQPIGVDGLVSQQEHSIDLLHLIYGLTPAQGRGIPFWLDIIDREVRVTDQLMQTLVTTYIEPELRYRLLTSKRSNRVI